MLHVSHELNRVFQVLKNPIRDHDVHAIRGQWEGLPRIGHVPFIEVWMMPHAVVDVRTYNLSNLALEFLKFFQVARIRNIELPPPTCAKIE